MNAADLMCFLLGVIGLFAGLSLADKARTWPVQISWALLALVSGLSAMARLGGAL